MAHAKRAFLLAGAGEIGVNPDQRIHEDAHHLAELSTDLGAGLFQAMLLLASFIGRPLDPVGRRGVRAPWAKLRYPRLYGLVCAFLCRRGVLGELACRPTAH